MPVGGRTLQAEGTACTGAQRQGGAWWVEELSEADVPGGQRAGEQEASSLEATVRARVLS